MNILSVKHEQAASFIGCRLSEKAMHRIQNGIDSVIVTSALGYAASKIAGINVPDVVIMSIGPILLGIGKGLHYFGLFLKTKAEASKLMAEAKVMETFSDPEVFRMLEKLKCYNAPECGDRQYLKEDAS